MCGCMRDALSSSRCGFSIYMGKGAAAGVGARLVYILSRVARVKLSMIKKKAGTSFHKCSRLPGNTSRCDARHSLGR